MMINQKNFDWPSNDDRFQNRLESTHFEPIPSLRTTLYAIAKSYKVIVLISVLRFGLVSAFGYLALDRYQHQFLLSWIEDFNHFFISFSII
ncbi:unnamed protein product [Rhizophagus irregularis]|nr:unnamed protein product [Rhizophagus irregularis]